MKWEKLPQLSHTHELSQLTQYELDNLNSPIQ